MLQSLDSQSQTSSPAFPRLPSNTVADPGSKEPPMSCRAIPQAKVWTCGQYFPFLPTCRHSVIQPALQGAFHAGSQDGPAKETRGGGRRSGSLVAGKDSRLIAGVLVEAAGEDKFAQHNLLQRGRGVLFPSGQNVDVVEAVPLPHSIHP